MKIKPRKHSEVVFVNVQIKTSEQAEKLAKDLEGMWLSISYRSLRVTFMDTYVAPGIGFEHLKKSKNEMVALLGKLLAKLENDKTYASGKAKKKK